VERLCLEWGSVVVVKSQKRGVEKSVAIGKSAKRTEGKESSSSKKKLDGSKLENK
jgi:hypothetical protein